MHSTLFSCSVRFLRATILLLTLLSFFISVPTFAQDQPVTAASAQAVEENLQRLQRDGGEIAQVSQNPVTGQVSFLRLSLPAKLALPQVQNASLAEPSMSFFTQYGAMFGVTDPSRQLQLRNTATDQWGGVHLHYSQIYEGVEVFGGELRTHFSADGRLTAVNGIFIPDIQLDLAPVYSDQSAIQIALATVQKAHNQQSVSLDLAALSIKQYIYRAGLAQGISGRNHLASAIQVANPARTIHELVFVDAHTGQTLEQISLAKILAPQAQNRQVYIGAFDPAALVWSEGDPLPYTGPDAPAINNLIDFSEDTYNLFASLSGGTYLSFDGADATMHSVLIPDDFSFCPGAFWVDPWTEFCRGVTGDDSVVHSWAHAYTDFTHGLAYQWQPGAINEAYSDIFGEVVDLLNGAGLDTNHAGPRTTGACSIFSGVETGDDSYRWLVGEDSPGLGGVIRDLWNPNCHGDAGKVSDEAYRCARDNSGGIDSNSGIPNHAFALLVDGGDYNGQIIQPIGLTKAAHLYWHAATVYQTSVTQFADHADALEASCNDLAATGAELPGLSTESPVPFGSGEQITAADCAEVSKAIAAGELRTEPVQCNFQPLLNPTAPPLCEGQGEVQTIALSDWEAGLDGWNVGRRDVANPDDFTYQDWQVIGDLPAERAGQALFGDNNAVIGNCSTEFVNGVRYVESPPIAIPSAIAAAHLAVDHLVNIEYGWDGGNFKLSVNGGPWKLIQPAAFTFNGYNDLLFSPGASDDPLAGESGFTGDNPNFMPWNWGQSQINLAGLVQPGDEIRLRFELGTDCGLGLLGWHVDDVRVYACSAEQPPAPTNSIYYFSSSSSGTVNGIKFKDEDILAYDTFNKTWALYFDGSNVGVARLDLDAFEVRTDGAILMSFNTPATIGGLPVDDSDIVLFTPTSLGANQTSGSFSLHMVGAEWGLETDGEDIDGISFTPGGVLVISTNGRLTNEATEFTARDEDLAPLNDSPLPYFVGANVGLTKDSEDIGASWIDPLTGKLYLATRGSFKLDDGLHGNQDDLWVCDPTALWDQTACQSYKLWDGAAGLRNEQIDGFSAGTIWPEPTAGVAHIAEEEQWEAEEDAAVVDDVAEEGGTTEEETESWRSFLPLIQQ